jgi:hypothetical protein
LRAQTLMVLGLFGNCHFLVALFSV